MIRVARRTFLVLTLVLVFPWELPANANQRQTPEETKPAKLSLASLRPQCQLERKWIGSVFDLPWGVWLRCGEGEPILVTHPRNLLGKVSIDSPEQALEFLRFFSSAHKHEMFRLDGMLEVTPSKEEWGQNIINLTELGERYHPPQVRSRSGEGFCYNEDGAFYECERTEYVVTRVVIFYDNNMYRALETLSEDGFYTLVSKELMLEDLSRFGLLHLPPH